MHREHEKATDPSSKPSICQDMSTFMKSYKSHKPFFIFYKSSGLLWHTQVHRSFSEGISVREVRMYMGPEPVFQHPACHCTAQSASVETSSLPDLRTSSGICEYSQLQLQYSRSYTSFGKLCFPT